MKELQYEDNSLHNYKKIQIYFDIPARLPDVRCPYTVTEAMKSFRKFPAWLYSQVTYSRVWKKTKETQIRADMESELTTLPESATTNAQRSRINILEEMSVQEGTLAKPHQGRRHEKTHMTYARYLSPCLVNLIIFLPKQLPENGSLHHHFSRRRQGSSTCRHHAIVVQPRTVNAP